VSVTESPEIAKLRKELRQERDWRCEAHLDVMEGKCELAVEHFYMIRSWQKSQELELALRASNSEEGQ
jgi:hypothetical protein